MIRKVTKPNQKKVDIVQTLKDKLGKTKALFVTEYRGLTHQQLEALRKSLKKVEAEYIVAKNRLLHLALSEWNKDAAEKLKGALNNPTATLLAFGDEIQAIKTLSAFIKTAHLPTIKLGIFGGNIATEADFAKLATLPSRDLLLATLAVRLKGPIYGFHWALKGNLQKLATVLDNMKSKKPAN